MRGPRSIYGRLAREALGPDAPAREVYRHAVNAKNHAHAVAEGRIPGRIGRPIGSNHHRAEYWREWARKRKRATVAQKESINGQ